MDGVVVMGEVVTTLHQCQYNTRKEMWVGAGIRVAPSEASVH